MTKRVFNLTLFVWCLLLVSGGRSAAASEQEKLEGTWSFVKSSKDANKPESRAAVRMVLKGDTISFVAEGNRPGAQGTYTVDPSKNPKTMDITLDNDGVKRMTLAIYELEGGTLKLCHYLGAKASKERPKEFVANQQTALGILKRERQ